VNYKIVDSVIKSKKKMTYEELDKMFETETIEDTSYIPFLESLNIARELSAILTNCKNKRGNLDFESSDMKIKKDAKYITLHLVFTLYLNLRELS
jgi:exoribonuclease R